MREERREKREERREKREERTEWEREGEVGSEREMARARQRELDGEER